LTKNTGVSRAYKSEEEFIMKHVILPVTLATNVHQYLTKTPETSLDRLLPVPVPVR
jgi:hypothetical protein